jgi:hypothetical protein
MSEQLEYAVLRHADGRPTPSRPDVERDLNAARAALRAAGGRPPMGRNGRRQVWNRALGWHDDQRDELADPLVPFLSPLARARHLARRRAATDAALVADALANRHPRDLAVRQAQQRIAERSIADTFVADNRGQDTFRPVGALGAADTLPSTTNRVPARLVSSLVHR